MCTMKNKKSMRIILKTETFIVARTQVWYSYAQRGVKNMASSKDYLQFILEQLSDLEEITYRAMMGEYILYYRGKIVGGIYDDRLLVKPVKSAISYMPETVYELPYEGAKEMLFVDNVDDKEFLAGLFRAMYDELPAPKKKKIDSFKLAIDMFSDDFMEDGRSDELQ